MKQAENRDDLIVRACETSKIATTAAVRLPHPDRVINTSFAPCEIKTFRIPRDSSLAIKETTLLEWDGA